MYGIMIRLFSSYFYSNVSMQIQNYYSETLYIMKD